MNWDALAAIGKLVGAGAVLATLAFLAVQLRDAKRVQQEANNLARSAAADRAYDRFSGFRRLLSSDSGVARIWLAGCAAENLDELDHERFRHLAVDYLFASTVWIRRMDAVGVPARSEIAIQALVAELRRYPGLRPFWAEVTAQASETTRAAVSEALSD